MIRPPWGSACNRYERELLDFAGGQPEAASRAALDHLDRCDACRRRCTDVALAVAAMHAIARDLQDVTPPAEAWPRLRAVVTRPRSTRWRRPATLAGSIVSVMLVAVVVSPTATQEPPAREEGLVVSPQAMTPSELPDWLREAAYAAASRHAPATQPNRRGPQPATAINHRQYPDGIRPERKEVERAKPISGNVPAAS